jgi:hypothetical protein
MAAWCFVGAKILGDLRFEAVFTLICGPMPVFQRNLRPSSGGSTGLRYLLQNDELTVQEKSTCK